MTMTLIEAQTMDIGYTTGFAAQPALAVVAPAEESVADNFSEIEPVAIPRLNLTAVAEADAEVEEEAAAESANDEEVDEVKEASFMMKMAALVMTGVLLFPLALRVLI